MENIVVLNEEHFEDIIYRTVSRCLNEKNIGNLVEKPEDEGFYDRDEICDLLHIKYPTILFTMQFIGGMSIFLSV